MFYLYNILFLIALISWGRISPKPRGLGPLERMIFGLGFGWTIPGLAIYILGFAGLYYPFLILSVFFLPAAIWCGLILKNGFACEISGPFHNYVNFLKSELGKFLFFASTAFFIILWAALTFAAGMADISIDPYHVFMPLAYLRRSGVFEMPGDVVSTYSKLWEMIYLAAATVDAETLPSMLNVYQWLITGAVIFLLGRLFYSSKIGLLAAGFTLLTAWPLNIATMAQNDFAPMITGHLGVLCMGAYLKRGGDRFIIWAGICWGLTMLSKVAGAFYIFPVYAAFFFYVLFIRRLWKPVIAAALFGVIVSAPWWGYNLACTGNPVYPAAYKIFPSEEPYQAAAELCVGKHSPTLKYFRSPVLLHCGRFFVRTCVDGEGPTFLFYVFLIPWLIYCLRRNKDGKRDWIGVALAVIAVIDLILITTPKGRVRLCQNARPVINLVAAAAIITFLRYWRKGVFADYVILLFLVGLFVLNAGYLKKYRGFAVFPVKIGKFLQNGRPWEKSEEAENMNRQLEEDDFVLCGAEMRYRRLKCAFIPQQFYKFRYGSIRSFYFRYIKEKDNFSSFGEYLGSLGITHIYTDYSDPKWNISGKPVFRWEKKMLTPVK